LANGRSGYELEGRKEVHKGDKEGFLVWASELRNSAPYAGGTDYTRISNLKDAMLELKSKYFNPETGLTVIGPDRDELNRRFLHVEHEIEGLLRRRIDYHTRDHITGDRTLDLSQVLHEKECEVVELQRKIVNLEAKLRKAESR
jgi:hypothetical protein